MTFVCPPGYDCPLTYINNLRENVERMRKLDADAYAESIQRAEAIIMEYEGEQAEIRR